MRARSVIGVVAILLAGCATSPDSAKPGRNYNAKDLSVDLTSDAREVLNAVPAESAMERVEMIDAQGRTISYIAFTDTDTGALVFVNQKLHGTLSHHDAQTFYSCRGYVTATYRHWAREAPEWAESLLAVSSPATSVKLEFSGKSTVQSLREAVGSPLLSRLKSLLNLGSNPLSIIKNLDSARDEMEARDKFEKALKGLSDITPGMSEARVAEVVKPEDVSFASGGIIMAYPSHLVEYFVTEGVVKVIQQPSFHYLSRTHAALFYAAETQWSLCTPRRWKEALPAAH